MNKSDPRNEAALEDSGRSTRRLWFLAACCLAAIVIVILSRHKPDGRTSGIPSVNEPQPGHAPNFTRAGNSKWPPHRSLAAATTGLSAEQIVAGKVIRFAQKRRALAHALAGHFKVTVTDDVERFFAAAEAGRYDEMEALYNQLKEARHSQAGSDDLGRCWRAVTETAGAAESAHDWPAQKLLDYGQTILGSLSPGTIYVGGTDPGCFIPTMLNETSEGEQHVVLTQNALADNSYVDYLNYLYADRLTTLTQDDSQRAFQDYTADAQKRLQHDQQFPDEPKQVRPGENISFNDNGILQISGQVAVMAINERLLQTLVRNNSDASFALEESFSLPSTYAGAVPLGPIMALRDPNGQNALTSDTAAQSPDFWRATAQQLLADPETPEGSDPRKAYAHMAQAQANLLASQNFNDQAEQDYRIAGTLWPDSTEILGGLSGLLAHEGRATEANQLLDDFARNYPGKLKEIDTIRQILPIPTVLPPPHPH